MGETLTLLFRKHKENAYEVRVKESWSGRTVIGSFIPPYTSKQVHALQKKLNSLKSDDQELRIIGQHLFSALCGNEATDIGHHEISEQSVQAVLRSVIQRTLRRRGTVALTFCFEPECDEFVQYPWELLHNGDHFLLASGIFTLSRALLRPDIPLGCELPIHLPMRVLYIGSSPSDCASLETERSFQALQNGLAPLIETNQVFVDKLEPATFDELVRYLSSYGGVGTLNDSETTVPCYVVHFDGHGAYGRLCTKNSCEKLNDPSAQKCVDCGASLHRIKPQTYLCFCTETGCNRYIDTQSLRELFLSGDVRLAVFSACETATVSTVQSHKQRTTAVDATLATALVMAQVPAVVAMPFSLQDDISPTFMYHFYEAVADGRTLEEALSRARQALLPTHQRSWFIPVLYRHVVEGKEGPVPLIVNENEETPEEHNHPLEHLDVPTSYIGREQELNDLGELLSLATQDARVTATKTHLRLRPGTHHIALTGSAGIGKSALACEAVLRNQEKFPGSIIGISLQGGKSFGDALIEMLHYLHVPLKSGPTADLVHRSRLVLNTLRSLASRELPCLFLVDRFDEVKDHSELEQWLHFLCAFPPEVVVLVTSRSNPDAMIVVDGSHCRWYEYHVGKMTDADLLKLFIDLAASNGLDQYIHLNNPEQQAILREICTLLDGYPLGAELIFGAARSINGKMFAPEAATRSLEEIRDELRNTPLAGILAVLDVSYRRLSPIAQLLLAYLSAFKLPFSREQIVMLVAPETSTSTEEAVRLIQQQDVQQGTIAIVEKVLPSELAMNWRAARDELVQASFISFDGRVYMIHLQVRHFAISHLPIEERRRVHRLVATYYYNLPQPSPEEWVAAVEHLESAGEAQDLQESVQVAVRASWALGGRGHAQELLAMLRRANVHASRLGDKTGEGQIQCCLGAILRQLGQYAEAEACLRSSLEFHKEQHTRDEAGWALYELAMLCREEGNFQQANLYAQEGLMLFREISDSKGEAWMQMVLGEVHRGYGAYYDALGHFELALTSFTTLRNKEGIASTLRDRGTVYEAIGKYGDASADYEEALHIFNELGLRASQAWVLADKSVISKRQGKLDDAEKLCAEAITIFREHGIRRGEAWALRAMGDIVRYRRDWEKARMYYNETEAIFTALGDNVDRARVLNALGAISFDEADYVAAQEHYEQAHILAQEQGAKQIDGRALRGLGDVARVLLHFEDAERHYTVAFTVATELDTPAEQCAVLHRQGLLRQQQKRFYDALDCWVHALALDRRLGHPTRTELQTRVANIVKEQQLEEAYIAFCKQYGLGCES
ncbi:MAG: hypothetical protein NVS4B12_01110 [Ktedonobacteraceae bacterium]